MMQRNKSMLDLGVQMFKRKRSIIIYDSIPMPTNVSGSSEAIAHVGHYIAGMQWSVAGLWACHITILVTRHSKQRTTLTIETPLIKLAIIQIGTDNFSGIHTSKTHTPLVLHPGQLQYFVFYLLLFFYKDQLQFCYLYVLALWEKY
uniref:Uncharacterized protein n=1 Tax=Opuntia streptacantha TaxID=393608 RepID=A0A7C9E3X1_OPUST